MRIILLPVTAQRSIVYYQKLAAPRVRTKLRLDERIASKASSIWAGFEKSDKNWKKKVVRWTSKLLDTIPFEESGLKSVPPRNTYMRTLVDEKQAGTHISERQAIEKNMLHSLAPIEVVYPSTSKYCPDFNAAHSIMGKLIATASTTHRKQIVWCVLGLPLTLPFAINPFIPNFPGIYLVYRIWSNWLALKGAKHLHFLLQHHQLTGTTLPALNHAYEKHAGPMDVALAENIHRIFNDKNLYRELKQAVRQTKKDRAPSRDN